MEAAFFDLDKTVISHSSVIALGRPLYREGFINAGALLRGLWGQLVFVFLGADENRMEKAREGLLSLTKGWDRDRLVALIDETVETIVTPMVYAEAIDLIHEHHNAGRKVFIVSSSPEEVVAPLARLVGADDVVSTRAEILEGRYTGRLEFYAYGPHKGEAIREIAQRQGIDLSASYAYSDSVTDVPMLETVGHSVAVNPDRDLRRIAEERGWTILDFRRPMALRERIPTPPPDVAAGVGLAVVATGGALWWWRSRHHEVPGLERVLVSLRLIRPRNGLPERARAAARSLGATALSTSQQLLSRQSRG